jgi:adenylate cyclase
LIIGTEHYLITLALGVISVGLVILQEIMLPRDIGFASKTLLFLTNFSATIVIDSAILYAIIFYAVKQMERAETAADREQQRSEGLLVNILPPRVAERLKQEPGTTIADAYDEASVLFADMAGFTSRAADTPPHNSSAFSTACSPDWMPWSSATDWRRSRRPATPIWSSAACPWRTGPCHSARRPRSRYA